MDLRGRWKDNPGIVERIARDARKGVDWTLRLKAFLAEDSERAAPKGHPYKRPPDLRHIILDELDLTDASLAKSNLAHGTAFRVVADRAKLDGSKLVGLKCGDAQLNQSSLRNVDARHAYFGHSSLIRADFTGADLRYASFRDADLAGACFCNADLRSAHLTEARCDGADFNGAKIYGAALWNMEYERVSAVNVDLSREADGSVCANHLSLAALVHSLEEERTLAELVSVVKLKTAVILGCDSNAEALRRLEKIAAIGRDLGLMPILVKDQREIPGEAFLKKALMYCLLSRFVVLENSYPAGQILELEKALNNGCVVAVLQEKGAGSTWLLEEKFAQFQTVRRFWYRPRELDRVSREAYRWCAAKVAEMATLYGDLYEALELEFVSEQ